MVLPQIPSSILQAVSASQTTLVTLKPEAALDLPPAQQPFLTVEIQPSLPFQKTALDMKASTRLQSLQTIVVERPTDRSS